MSLPAADPGSPRHGLVPAPECSRRGGSGAGSPLSPRVPRHSLYPAVTPGSWRCSLPCQETPAPRRGLRPHRQGDPLGLPAPGTRGDICPSPRRRLISLPALPRPSAAAAASPATAGGLFHSNSLRWLPREGYFYPGTGLWQDIPPAFSAGWFFHLPNSGGASTARVHKSCRELRVDRDAPLCLPRPASTSASTAAHPASSTPCTGPGRLYLPASHCWSTGNEAFPSEPGA